MPIDYKKYPSNWLKEIRPKIMKRANNTCECEGCDFKHLEEVWAVRYRGRTTGWFRDFDVANSYPKTIEGKLGKIIPNPKKVKVILTIAHLDHDETNHEVTDDRLKAMCQICHLRYDAKEKYRRSFDLSKYTGIDKEKVLNNCVAPEIGLAIFQSALDIYDASKVKQIGLFTELDPLDDENSEINKIGREIAQMSDEEFDANIKNLERIFKRTKK